MQSDLQSAFRKPKGTSSSFCQQYKIFRLLYTTIPHDKLKSKLKEIINQCFFHKNGNRRFQYVVIGCKDTYFVRDHSDAPQKYSDADVIKMLEYLIDHIFVEFGGRIFQETIGIPMGTVPGRFGPGSFRPGHFGLGRFGQFWGWVVSALVGGSFRPWVVSPPSHFGPISI